MYRRLAHIALPTTLVVAALGCDSQETTRPDAELFVGTWTGETVNAETVIGLAVPVLDLEEEGDVARFTFEADGTYSFLFDPAEGRTLDIPETDVSIPLEQTVSFAGNYTLDANADTIFLTAGDFPAGLTLGYDFHGDDAVDVIAEDPDTLGALVGLATDAEALQALASVVTGGSIRYTRD